MSEMPYYLRHLRPYTPPEGLFDRIFHPDNVNTRAAEELQREWERAREATEALIDNREFQKRAREDRKKDRQKRPLQAYVMCGESDDPVLSEAFSVTEGTVFGIKDGEGPAVLRKHYKRYEQNNGTVKSLTIAFLGNIAVPATSVRAVRPSGHGLPSINAMSDFPYLADTGEVMRNTTLPDGSPIDDLRHYPHILEVATIGAMPYCRKTLYDDVRAAYTNFLPKHLRSKAEELLELPVVPAMFNVLGREIIGPPGRHTIVSATLDVREKFALNFAYSGLFQDYENKRAKSDRALREMPFSFASVEDRLFSNRSQHYYAHEPSWRERLANDPLPLPGFNQSKYSSVFGTAFYDSVHVIRGDNYEAFFNGQLNGTEERTRRALGGAVLL